MGYSHRPFLEEGQIVIHGGVSHQSFVGVQLSHPVLADNGGEHGDGGSRQQVGMILQTGGVVGVHDVLQVLGAVHVRLHVLQEALLGGGGVGVALEVQDVRVQHFVDDGQRHHFHVLAGGSIDKGEVHVHALFGHLFIQRLAESLTGGIVGGHILEQHRDLHGSVGSADVSQSRSAAQQHRKGQQQRNQFLH